MKLSIAGIGRGDGGGWFLRRAAARGGAALLGSGHRRLLSHCSITSNSGTSSHPGGSWDGHGQIRRLSGRCAARRPPSRSEQ
uniref:Uncharacterized protein n=1 Tax=Leersia perrieri TaxID=77586 RepID=A0A0D9XL36_9ORYZ